MDREKETNTKSKKKKYTGAPWETESKRGKLGRKSPKQSKSLVGVQEDEKMFRGKSHKVTTLIEAQRDEEK